MFQASTLKCSRVFHGECHNILHSILFKSTTDRHPPLYIRQSTSHRRPLLVRQIRNLYRFLGLTEHFPSSTAFWLDKFDFPASRPHPKLPTRLASLLRPSALLRPGCMDLSNQKAVDDGKCSVKPKKRYKFLFCSVVIKSRTDPQEPASFGKC